MNVSCEPEFDMNCNRTSYNPSPLNLRLHCHIFPSLSRSRSGPRRRPPPRCVRCGMVNKWESSEEDCTWRAWRLGPTRSMVARKESSSLLSWKKCFLHLTAGTHRLYLRTEGSASLFCEKKYSSRWQLGPVRFGDWLVGLLSGRVRTALST